MSDQRVFQPAADWPHLADIGEMFVRLHRHYTETGYPFHLVQGGEDGWVRRLSAGSRTRRLFVLECEGRPSGFLEASWLLAPPYLSVSTIGRVDHIWVEPVARGGGGARLLVAAAEQWLFENADAIWLETISGNPDAKRFWEGLGYARIFSTLHKSREIPSS